MSYGTADLSGKIILSENTDLSDRKEFSDDNSLHNKNRSVTLVDSDPETDTVTASVESECRKLSLKDPSVKCIVISIPGIISPDGTILECDFSGLSGINLKNRISSDTGIPVITENDVNLAAEGYHFLHPDCTNLAVLYQPGSDPAGAGIIINRNLLHGLNGFSGEIGRPGRARQMELLKDNPASLVRLQLEMMTAILSPERIAWYCPLIEEDIELDDIRPDCRPKLERLDSLDALICSGAESLGRNAIMNTNDQMTKKAI